MMPTLRRDDAPASAPSEQAQPAAGLAGLRRTLREATVPLGPVLRRIGIGTVDDETSAARETPVIGSLWATGFVVVVALALALFAGGSDAYVQTVIGLFAAYLVGALGYNLVLGSAGQFAFCQNAFMAVGAYGYAVTEPHVGQVLALVIGALAAAITGLVVGVAIIRTRDIYLALLTLAFSQAALLAVELWPPTKGDNGIFVQFAGSRAYLAAIVAAAATALLVQRLLRSRTGRAFALIRTDEQAAAAMGVNVPVTRMAAFGVSGLLGGISGVLLAAVLTFITPTNFTLQLSLLLLTMIVIGGLSSVWGTAVGVAIMVAIQQYLPSAGSFGDYLDGALLFVILVVRPRGLASLVSLRRGGGHG